MALTDITTLQNQYGSLFSPYGNFNSQAQNLYQNMQPSYAYNPNAMGNYTAYTAAQAMFPEVPYIEPAFDTRQKVNAQQLLGLVPQDAQLGKGLFGEKGLFPKFLGKDGTASSLINKIKYAKGPQGSIAYMDPANPGVQVGSALDGQIPKGMEGMTPSKFSTVSGKYLQGLKAGTAQTAIPTYLAGRLIRSAFDDDDPTTFTGGEMLGAGVSGAGAGAFIGGKLATSAIGGKIAAGLGMKAAALGPVGIMVGIGLSLLGGKRKRDKARKKAREQAQRDYEQAVADRKAEIRQMYLEGIEQNRQAAANQFQSQQYYQQAAKYGNTYGMGNYSQGGVFDEGGMYDEVPRGEDVFDFLSDEDQEKELFIFGGRRRRRRRRKRKGKKKRGLFGKLKKAVSKGMKKVGKVIKKPAKVLSKGLKAATKPVKTVAKTATTVADKAIKTTGKVGKTALKTTAKVATEATKPVAKVTSKALKPVAKTVKKVADATVKPVVSAVGSTVSKVVDTGVDFAMDAVKFAGKVATKGMEAVGKVAFPVIDATLGTAGRAIKKGIDKIRGKDKDEPEMRFDPLPEMPEMRSALIPAAMGVGASSGVAPGFVPRVLSGGPDISGGSAGFAQRAGDNMAGFYSQNQLQQG